MFCGVKWQGVGWGEDKAQQQQNTKQKQLEYIDQAILQLLVGLDVGKLAVHFGLAQNQSFAVVEVGHI